MLFRVYSKEKISNKALVFGRILSSPLLWSVSYEGGKKDTFSSSTLIKSL